MMRGVSSPDVLGRGDSRGRFLDLPLDLTTLTPYFYPYPHPLTSRKGLSDAYW